MFRIDRARVTINHKDARGDRPDTGEAEAAVRPDAPRQEEVERRARETVQTAQRQAEDIMAIAEQQAGRLLLEAQEQCAAIRDAARAEGFEQGAAQAHAEAEQEIARLRADVEALLRDITRQRAGQLEELEGDLVGLAFDMARKILNTELDRNDDAFVSLVKNAVSSIKDEGKITIMLGPEDYRRYFEGGVAQFIINNETVTAAVVEKPHFVRGDCVIESDGETIDAGIESQFRCIQLALREESAGAYD